MATSPVTIASAVATEMTNTSLFGYGDAPELNNIIKDVNADTRLLILMFPWDTSRVNWDGKRFIDSTLTYRILLLKVSSFDEAHITRRNLESEAYEFIVRFQRYIDENHNCVDPIEIINIAPRINIMDSNLDGCLLEFRTTLDLGVVCVPETTNGFPYQFPITFQ